MPFEDRQAALALVGLIEARFGEIDFDIFDHDRSKKEEARNRADALEHERDIKEGRWIFDAAPECEHATLETKS